MASHLDPGRAVGFDGDSAVMVTLGHCIDPKINDACVRLGNRVRAANLAGVRDVVEGYTTVTVHFDLRNVSREFVHQEVVRLLGELGGETVEPQTNSIREVTLPVCYDNEFALDLADVAAFGRCTQEEVIRIHANLTYRVYMLGFQPGFAYLGSVNAEIASPRRETPRINVPAGSVGIAGRQTGVYPCDSPGGWQIIGRCPSALVDWNSETPFVLRPGDRVKFKPIDRTTYDVVLAESR